MYACIDIDDTGFLLKNEIQTVQTMLIRNLSYFNLYLMFHYITMYVKILSV